MRKIVALSFIGVLCWIVMFLAGTDVWHFADSPDFWHLSGPPHDDLRALGYAFYLQFVVFLAMIAVGIRTEMKSVPAGRRGR